MPELRDSLNFYRDEFNKIRALIAIGRELQLVSPLLNDMKRVEMESYYAKGDIAWLKHFIREVRNDATK
jgi:hypothetical protein